MRRVALVCVAGAALLAGCGLGGPEYPQFGQTAYRIEGLTTPPGGGEASRTVIYRDAGRMRVEATLPAIGPATIVFDDTTHAAYVLNPAHDPNTVITPAMAAIAATADDAEMAQLAPPNVAVRIDDADAPQPLETAWEALGEQNARSTGRCEVAGEVGHEWRPREAQAGVERTACITPDGIVLRVSEDGHVLWEATSLERGRQQASLFGVPAGYRLIDPLRVADADDRTRAVDGVTTSPSPERPRG